MGRLLGQVEGKLLNTQSPAISVGFGAWLFQLYEDIGLSCHSPELAVKSKVFERLINDVQASCFPDICGWRGDDRACMGDLAQLRFRLKFDQQRAGQLPRHHAVAPPTKAGNEAAHERCTAQAVKSVWRRSRLEVNIKNQLQQRQRTAATNFASHKPAADSALVVETFNAPYLPVLLGSAHGAHQRKIESPVIARTRALGQGDLQHFI